MINMSRTPQYISYRENLPIDRNISLSDQTLLDAINGTNAVFDKLSEVAPHIYELLGLRNLSSFVGATFIKELETASNRLLITNPHQDGYPDLLLMDEIGLRAMESIGAENRSKAPYSPFQTGGIEIKATCGDVPTAKDLVKKGLNKPIIGQERIDLVTAFSWKAHHRDTNNLLGITWDFIEGIPAITSVSFSNDLNENDWGKIVTPKEDGGRTTSVSIMAKSGIKKMFSGTIFIIDDERYVQKIAKMSKN